ncbi:hypothetical protein THOM_2857 [Trachipleistophora hominis]|uniref:Uncharacterized protein n=1 Tax=Trachipleistophora hominis TaxID=72359 RepID=L7JT58_TRAHO|nr:hypothetical protein THOM_2857 [Trachipleistophora hominis]
MQRFLELNLDLEKYYQLARDITNKRINNYTALQYYKTEEDIKYLFKINSLKVFGEVKGTLQMLVESAGEDEKQIIDFLLRRKRTYKSALLVILCILSFKFVIHARGRKNRKKNTSSYKFKFETNEEAFLYYLYIVNNVDKRYISILNKKIRQLPLRMAFIAAYLLKCDELMKQVLDRWHEDYKVPQYVFEVYEPSYEYISTKMITLPNRDLLNILRIVNIDRIRIVKSFLNECMKQFMVTNDEKLLNRNLSFNEICLEVSMSENVFKYPDENSFICQKERKETKKATADEVERRTNHTDVYDEVGECASKEHHLKCSNIQIMKKIVYAWLRFLLITNNYLLFMDMFEKLREDSCPEYKVLKEIHNRITNVLKGQPPNFSDILSSYHENNEFSLVSLQDLGEYLCKIRIV